MIHYNNDNNAYCSAINAQNCETRVHNTVYISTFLHSVKKQVQLHFSYTAVSSEDSSATDLLMLQTQYKVVHHYTLPKLSTFLYTRNLYSYSHLEIFICIYSVRCEIAQISTNSA